MIWHKLLFEDNPVPMWVFDFTTARIVDVNRVAVAHYGFTRDEFLGMTLDDLHLVGEPERSARAKAGGVALRRHRRKDGSLIDVEVTWQPFDLPGCAAAGIAMAQDITERLRMERRSLEGYRLLESIVENIPDMIFIKDAKDLRFVLFNKAGEALLGRDREELIGRTDYDLFPREQADFFTREDRRTLDSRDSLDIPEEYIDTRFRGRRLLRTKKIPILDGEGRAVYLCGISEDITDKKRMEDSLRQKSEDLARANQELAQFASIAAHDLQEPLRKIMVFGDLLRKRLAGSLDPDSGDYLQRMQRSAERMTRFIEDLLTLTRTTTKVRPLECVELAHVAREVLSDLEPMLSQSGARVELGPLPRVAADPSQMRQLLQNLIANGIKFRRKGEPAVVTVRGKSLGNGFCEITVEDNGIGFEEKYLDRIFKPFQRLHTRSEYEGSGLGLAICDRIALRHGGTITAKSSPGKGSVFIVTLSTPYGGDP